MCILMGKIRTFILEPPIFLRGKNLEGSIFQSIVLKFRFVRICERMSNFAVEYSYFELSLAPFKTSILWFSQRTSLGETFQAFQHF